MTDADCTFEEGANLQCVEGECVPRRSELVSSSLELDARWTADRRWIVDGVVVVNEGTKLAVDAGTHIEVRPHGVLVFESSDSFAAPAGFTNRVIIHSEVGEDAVFMADGSAIPQTVVFQ